VRANRYSFFIIIGWDVIIRKSYHRITHITTFAAKEGQGDDFDMQTAISRATTIVSRIADEWKALKPPHQQRLQRTVLPQGVSYQKDAGMFGTAILSPIFRLNETFLTSKSDFVAGAGIEPAISRL
jgi:hypothetical protein